MKNILEMLELSREKYKDKNIFCDSESSVTYDEFVKFSKNLGSYLAFKGYRNKPIALVVERSVKNLVAMAGVIYSGNFYTVIDSLMPKDRIETIFETLKPEAVIFTENTENIVKSLDFDVEKVYYNTAIETECDEKILSDIRYDMIDTDPLYVLFTSGSTGVPKGAVVSHKSVLAYTKWYCETFDISDKTVFGSQTPFYFSMSVSDVFSTMYCGATLHIIDKSLFSFPIRLIEFMNERKVNTVYWVPSALCIIANWKVLDYTPLEYLNKVLFAGEVMPTKQLNYWMSKMPNSMFANLFGPTETTDICTYYIVNRTFSDTETLPIGSHCNNCDVFIVNENGEKAKQNEEGELYARGSFLASGYYNNPEKTKLAFVQNPLNNAYPEIVYKTGDLVKYNENNELIYLSRIDFQIKHMGYRIELGEIEAAGGGLNDVNSLVCIYDSSIDKIIFIYQGKKREKDVIIKALKERLPDYMIPDEYIRIKAMPYNQNGKIDRKWLMNNYKTI